MQIDRSQAEKRTALHSSDFFLWFLLLFWTEHTIFTYVIQIFRRLPLIGQFYEYVFPVVAIALLACSIPYFYKTVRAIDLFFYIVCAIVVLGTSLLLPKNAVYIDERLYKTLVIGIPMYFIGVSYDHNKAKQYLYYASLIGIIFSTLYLFYKIVSGEVLVADDMDASYNALPSIMYLLYWAFEKPKTRTYITAIWGIILSISYGTRGPILVIIVFLVIAAYYKIFNKKALLSKIIFLVCSGIFVLLIMSSRLFIDFVSLLADLFGTLGLSSRIFRMIINGTVANDAGRNYLSTTIINAIKERPLLGYGLMGDRVILGRYVHNIILELWCDFGTIVGTALIGMLIWIYIKALYGQRSVSSFYFLLSMVCMIFVKLLLSGSFVYDQYFYLIIGICISFSRRNSKQKMKLVE